MKRLVTFEHGILKVSQPLAELLNSIKPKENTQYALSKVEITDSQIVATDGHRLLIVTPTDSFDPPFVDGLYHLTDEGFLLKASDEKKFPKWQYIIPKDKDTEILGDFVISGNDGCEVARIFRTILKTKVLFNIEWLLGTLARLKRCGCDVVIIKKQDGYYPFLITAESSGVSFQYTQMLYREDK